MRNISKGIDIGKAFPVYAVENGFIINKAAEYTVGFRVLLPEIFTISGAEYEMFQMCWVKAFKVLPDYCVIHKQDWFTSSMHSIEERETGESFLTRSFERNFNERPYLDHTCYLFITKTRKGRSHVESINSLLLRGNLIPEAVDEKTIQEFADAVSQMEQIINDCSLGKRTQIV